MNTIGDLDSLAASFARHLRAENKSAKTVETYADAIRQLENYLARAWKPGAKAAQVTREDVEGFITHLLSTRSAATASNRFRALQQFFRWLCAEEYLVTNPMERMRPPHVPEMPVPVLSVDALQALLATCKSHSFEDRRDEAIIRLLADTGIRRGELIGLRCEDVHLDEQVVSVLGKGRRPRDVPIGHRTIRALDRYDTLRRQHENAGLEWFWITDRGRLHESGIATMLHRRGERAGLGRIHPHQLRHTFGQPLVGEGVP